MSDEAKKHPCPDCRACQWCSDARCRICLSQGNSGCRRRKLSLREQIEFYEACNKPRDSE